MDKYPICPTWDEWCPPPTDSALSAAFASFIMPPPPPSLANSGYMDDLRFRDASCRVTGVNDGCEQAHLVPASEQDWWDRKMATISELRFEIESSQNGLFLRMDLHRIFDRGVWVPMVKKSKMVVHVLRTSHISNQFIDLYHNREMQELVGIDKRCLFARIAYSTVPLVSEFLSARRLAKQDTRVLTGGEVKEWTPEACESFRIKPRSRNPSPTKRTRLEQIEEHGLVVAALWHEDEIDEGEEYDSATTPDDVCGLNDSPRGRKRQRSSSRYRICLQKRKRSSTTSEDHLQRRNLSVDYPSPTSS
jgi:hypothetical protein